MAVSHKVKKLHIRNNKKLFSLALRIPALIVLIGLFLIPIISMFNISFRSLSFAIPGSTGQWVGLENYRIMWASNEFWYSIKITIIFVLIVIPSQLVLGFIIALLLDRNIRGRRIFTTTIITPMLLAPIVVGLMWLFMLNYDVGIAPYYLKLFGLDVGNLLGNIKTAYPAIILIEIWHWTPLLALMIFSGLQSLPQDPYEAAIVDGASRYQIFRHITIPLLRPVIIIAVILRGIDVFKIFDEIFILTSGGPGNSTEVINMLAFKINFLFWNMGQGATVGVAIFLIALISTAFLFILIREK
jgi:multiple sugar transport system permease protein